MLSFSLKATLKHTYCVCVRLLWPEVLIRQGWVRCFNPGVFTRKTKVTCRLLPENSWNCFQRFLIITWREYIISRPISQEVGDQGRPLILFFLLSCPLCCHHSFLYVWVTPTLTVIWALNIVWAFNTFQKRVLPVNNIPYRMPINFTFHVVLWKTVSTCDRKICCAFLLYKLKMQTLYPHHRPYYIILLPKKIGLLWNTNQRCRFNSVSADRWRLTA